MFNMSPETRNVKEGGGLINGHGVYLHPSRNEGSYIIRLRGDLTARLRFHPGSDLEKCAPIGHDLAPTFFTRTRPTNGQNLSRVETAFSGPLPSCPRNIRMAARRISVGHGATLASLKIFSDLPTMQGSLAW